MNLFDVIQKAADAKPKTLMDLVQKERGGKFSKRIRIMKGSVPGSFEHKKAIIETAVLHAAGFRADGDPWDEGEWKDKPWGTIVATFPEYAIVGGGYDGEHGFWKVPYKYDEDKKEVTAEDPTAVEQVYCDAETGKVVTDEDYEDQEEQGDKSEAIMQPV